MAAKGQIPTQADKRRSMTLKDRHGRKFFAVIEKATGVPTGLVQPLFQVADPTLIPPQKYMRFPEDQPGFLDIDYDAWEADAQASQREWEQNKAQLISELPGGAQSPMLHRHLGPRPINPMLVRAMRQNNRWALGFTDKKPPEAELLLPTRPILPDTPVFTETDPAVLTETDTGEEPQSSSTDLFEQMQAIKKRAPAGLKGTALSAWALKELERMAEAEAATTGG